MTLQVIGLSKEYVSGQRVTRAIDRLDFTIDDDEFVTIVGPSGCGKTTLLKCISGLLAPTAGSVSLNGKGIRTPPPELAAVFQDYSRSLFGWMNVTKNIALPIRKLANRAERDSRVKEAIEAVGLTKFAEHYPWQLSGGMQQRVAIARALAYRPQILLMDEPFASVDAQTRADLEDLVINVRNRYRMTILLVTHDVDEAIYMGDRVLILSSPPTTVREELAVNITYPRDQISTKELPEFSKLRRHVLRTITRDRTTEGVIDDDARADASTWMSTDK
jgi:NitT/TauT family transport system ATP-binding protein